MHRLRVWIALLLGAAVVLAIGGLVGFKLLSNSPPSGAATARASDSAVAAPVEVAPVRRGIIENRRTFSGSLDAAARVTVAPKVAGRLASLPVDFADEVTLGQVIARLDAAEFEQAVAQAEAELAVAEAERVQASSAEGIAQREFERVQTLHERGVASDSQLDTARADKLAAEAAVRVAEARLNRAEAALESARIRLGYATIRADWEGGDDTRVVAERYVEQGDTVSANTPLLSIVEIDPIDATIFATEREYALLAPGQPVTVRTDAHPHREWTGEVARVSPVFREGSRQAVVEVRIPNTDAALKPGMFARVQAVLGQSDDAIIVPEAALTERDGQTSVFLVSDDLTAVSLVSVRTGIRNAGMVELLDPPFQSGYVVTLGQQLLEDGSAISIPGFDDASVNPTPAATAAEGASGLAANPAAADSANAGAGDS